MLSLVIMISDYIHQDILLFFSKEKNYKLDGFENTLGIFLENKLKIVI